MLYIFFFFYFKSNNWDTPTNQWSSEIYTKPNWNSNTEKWETPKFQKLDWPTNTESWSDLTYTIPSNNNNFNYKLIYILISISFLILLIIYFLNFKEIKLIDDGISPIDEAILLNKNEHQY